MHHGEFRDPRLVIVHDIECPWTRDDDFFGYTTWVEVTSVEHVWGGRRREPVGHPDGELLAVARAA